MSPVEATIATTPTKNFVFLLLDQFSMIAFTSAIEPLRLANSFNDKPLYSWTLVSETGGTAVTSSNIEVSVSGSLGELNRNDTIIVCGGVNIKENTTRPVLNWLRREARKGMAVGGLCTASYSLAAAGLLNNKKCTIHWENYDSFEEEFPDVELVKSVFTAEGNRFTSAGGTASVDLMLKLIGDDHGPEITNWCADQMIYNSMRTEHDEPRLSIPTRIGVRHPKLSKVIQMMEQNIEEPISPSNLATDVGMSTRQLERLFRRYLDRSPKRYYMELRLQKARNLLMQTDMSVINVALACGFASPSHFSKCYRTQYETTPYRERGAVPNRPQ
ncbi:GlxA family transcriptional regulator [Amylibacter sp. SFDW26]|uniref:GlxA family transcriptional regulator n=1 Tax=Amylibacter sp. SFDW26 TaxID=2652722 RepID=UPI0012627FB2|nr:GlxA family transcriptional regulator [Amylibacter sp. SFDW26]KAB7610258.1 GlxA family transcriptional regulator [Amylibacter sp. SFDW26]